MDFRFGGLVAALWLAACAGVPAESTGPASTPATQTSAADPGDEQVCQAEEKTGTHMTRTVCRSKADMERERAAATRAMERSQRTANPVGGN